MDRGNLTGREEWYPYYAGFSRAFAIDAIQSVGAAEDWLVLDPWMGSGTTLEAASLLGIASIGIDLNPVMAHVARARAMSRRSPEVVLALAQDLLCKSELGLDGYKSDPLEQWFTLESALAVRATVSAIHRAASHGLDQQTASFFLLAIFRLVREVALPAFGGSNPTWVKTSSATRPQLDIPPEALRAAFLSQVNSLLELGTDPVQSLAAKVLVGDSRSLPLASDKFDLILTSPPYCTRIDYAVATRLELAALGIGAGTGFEKLRQRLIGTTKGGLGPRLGLPDTPLLSSFLAGVEAHPGKASKTYYSSQFRSYFASMTVSLRELLRVLRPGGYLMAVVQDSHYQNIHLDLPAVFSELVQSAGGRLEASRDHALPRALRQLNPKARSNTPSWLPTESVLLYTKPTTMRGR